MFTTPLIYCFINSRFVNILVSAILFEELFYAFKKG